MAEQLWMLFMTSDITGLSEVVVVGYGTTMRRNMASATSALKSQ